MGATPTLFASRLSALREHLQRLFADGAMICSPANIAYYTGEPVTAFERLFALLVPLDGTPVLVAPAFEEEALRGNLCGAHVVPWTDGIGPWVALGEGLMRTGMCAPAIEKAAVNVLVLERLQAVLGRRTFADAGPALTEVRETKDAEEIASLRRAGAVLDACLQELVAIDVVGRSERELAAELDIRAAVHGSQRPAFQTIVLAGENSALPHGVPGSRQLEEGDLVLVDFGAVVAGYCSDITRVFVVGRPHPRVVEVHAEVTKAQQLAQARTVAGARCGDIDAAARGHLKAVGLGQRFTHRTGHGIGLEPHEGPYLAAGEERRLASGAVVTVEPGVYVPGLGGIRIEDAMVVGDGPPEVLTSFPRELGHLSVRYH